MTLDATTAQLAAELHAPLPAAKASMRLSVPGVFRAQDAPSIRIDLAEPLT